MLGALSVCVLSLLGAAVVAQLPAAMQAAGSEGPTYPNGCSLPDVPRDNFTVMDIYLGTNELSAGLPDPCSSLFGTVLAICIQDLALAQGCCTQRCHFGFITMLKPDCILDAWDYSCSGHVRALFADAVLDILGRCLPAVQASRSMPWFNSPCPLNPQLRGLFLQLENLSRSDGGSASGPPEHATIGPAGSELTAIGLGNSSLAEAGGQLAVDGGQTEGAGAGEEHMGGVNQNTNGSNINVSNASVALMGQCNTTLERWPSYSHLSVASRTLVVLMKLPRDCTHWIGVIAGGCNTELPYQSGCCAPACIAAQHSVSLGCMVSALQLFCQDPITAQYAMRVGERCLTGRPIDCGLLLRSNQSAGSLPANSTSSPTVPPPANSPSLIPPTAAPNLSVVSWGAPNLPIAGQQDASATDPAAPAAGINLEPSPGMQQPHPLLASAQQTQTLGAAGPVIPVLHLGGGPLVPLPALLAWVLHSWAVGVPLVSLGLLLAEWV